VIYELSRELERLMRERKWPHRIRFEEYPKADFVGHTTLIVSRSDEASDQFGASKGRQTNAKYVSSRVLQAQATIRCRITSGSARTRSISCSWLCRVLAVPTTTLHRKADGT